MTQRVPFDPEKGIPDLVSQLGADSRRLLRDELRLAKLETSGSMARAGRGALWLGVAFAVVVVMLVAFTLFLATLIGRLANGHHWVGAATATALNLALGFWLLKRGLQDFGKAPYTMPQTRATLTLAKN